MDRLLSTIRRLRFGHKKNTKKQATMPNDSSMPAAAKASEPQQAYQPVSQPAPASQVDKQQAAQPAQPAKEELGFDPEALAAKYAEERAKRLRTDGNDQYCELKEVFGSNKQDSKTTSPNTRAPITEDVGVLVVGAGYGGLATAVRLLEQGVTDFKLIDKAGGYGGTWYYNTYPGAACDVESFIYMPLLEELGTIPTEKYAKGPELKRHAENIAKHWDLERRTIFQTEVKEFTWNETTSRWTVKTDMSDTITAKFVITASGVLHKSKLPALKGLKDYQGKQFHTSQWNYDITGGNPSDPSLTALQDLRVGIIGTGATSVQAIPHLGKWSKELFVFQRTPSSVGVRGNAPTDYEWFKSLPKDWQRKRRENFTLIITGEKVEADEVNDGWTEILKYLSWPGGESKGSAADMQVANMKLMNNIRARVDSLVEDKATAEALKPYYSQMCKRPCFHDEYLQTFNRGNVHLIDTDGKGVERITEKGIVANGVEYPVDLLIYATGFEFSTDYCRRNGITITGKKETLSEKWSNGIKTLHGIQSRDFPNAFVIQPSQSIASTNFLHSIDEQARQIAYVIGTCEKQGIKSVEPSEEAEAAWVKGVVDAAPLVYEAIKDCTPGYYNNEGKPDVRMMSNGVYPGGIRGFLSVMDDFQKNDALPGMDITKEGVDKHDLTQEQKELYVHPPTNAQGNQELVPVV